MTKVKTLGEKILHIRKVENLSQQEFCKITGAGLSAIKNLEAGTSDHLSTKTLFAITRHPRFKKYALWLISDDMDESDQTTPPPNPGEFEKMLQSMSDEEVGQLVEYMEFLISKRS